MSENLMYKKTSSARKSVSIHSTAIISKKAFISDGVEIGPYCIVGDNVNLGFGVKYKKRARLVFRLSKV